MSENQRVRLSKQLLKDSLIRLLHEKSIHDISVREICESAQINRTTFYKYYGSPYDLLEGIENELLAKIDGCLGPSDDGNYGNRLRKVLAYVMDNLELCRLLFNNNVDPEFPGRLISLPRIQEMLSEQLTGGRSEDEVKYISCFIVNGGFGIMRQWINAANPEPPERVASLIDSIFARLFSNAPRNAISKQNR